jgi:hypothetical protein
VLPVPPVPIPGTDPIPPGELPLPRPIPAPDEGGDRAGEPPYNCYIREAFVARLALKPELSEAALPPPPPLAVDIRPDEYCVYIPQPVFAP